MGNNVFIYVGINREPSRKTSTSRRNIPHRAKSGRDGMIDLRTLPTWEAVGEVCDVQIFLRIVVLFYHSSCLCPFRLIPDCQSHFQLARLAACFFLYGDRVYMANYY